jgi:hypothetical protein
MLLQPAWVACVWGTTMAGELDDLMTEHASHLVDALNAAAAGCPQAAAISIANAEQIAERAAGVVEYMEGKK